MTEATITINGKLLTDGEAMTIRVALENFASDLLTNGLGEDETGKAIAAGYLGAIRSIRVYARTA